LTSVVHSSLSRFLIPFDFGRPFFYRTSYPPLFSTLPSNPTSPTPPEYLSRCVSQSSPLPSWLPSLLLTIPAQPARLSLIPSPRADQRLPTAQPRPTQAPWPLPPPSMPTALPQSPPAPPHHMLHQPRRLSRWPPRTSQLASPP